MSRPTRTSFSALTTYESCPLSYKLYYFDNHKTEGGAAAQRGTRLHTACERFLKGEIEEAALTSDFRNIRGHLNMFKDLKAEAEQVWLCDGEGNYQEEENEHTRFKAVVDIHYLIGDVLFIYDLKTGRQYPEHADQLQSYAMLGMMRYPNATRVEVAGLYLEGVGHTTHYPREMLPHLLEYWKGRWNILFDAEEFPPTPSLDACRWCDYRKSKMGLCEFGG